MTLPVGPLAPYVTPAMLTAAPTGISWSTIPPGRAVTDEQREAEQLNICMRATAEVDAWCNQVLRATLDTETVTGPNFRMTYQQATGNTRIILSRWPVLQVTQVQVSPNSAIPRQWTALPAGSAVPEWQPIGVYGASQPSAAGEGGQSILVAPGATSWALGRFGYAVQVTYINGWPHCALTAASLAGASTVTVDDCTGWTTVGPTTADQPGAAGVLYDAGNQEVAQVAAASAAAGPGTLTLAAPLAHPHAAGVLLSALPASVQWACILYATAEALTRGATSTTVQAIPGGSGSGQGRAGSDGLVGRARSTLAPFRRTI